MDARTTPDRNHVRMPLVPLSLALAIVLTATAPGQTTRTAPESRPAAAQAESAEAAATRLAMSPQRDVRLRTPLLREGSHLVRVTGSVRPEDDGAWTFSIDPTQLGAPRYVLTLMPSALLGEMEQMIQASRSEHLVFEITGQVYVYRDRNYLMPTHPPLLVGHRLADIPATTRDADPAEPGGDTTADIIRDLERSIGPVARRGAASRTNPFGAYDAEPGEAGPALEGKILVERRGIVRRTGAGAYVVIFDADAEGGADPPMCLLPCLLLERLEDYARRGGERAAVLISGHVYSYRGRNYLRPTVFRIPFDRTKMQP